MNIIKNTKRMAFCSLFAFLFACATTTPEEKQAKHIKEQYDALSSEEQYALETAKNISIIRSRLESFVKGGDKLSKQRMALLAQFDQYVRELENDIEMDLKAMEIVLTACDNSGKCRREGKLRIFDNIVKLSEDIQSIQVNSQLENIVLQKSMLASQKQQHLSSKELSAIEKSLLTLGKPRDLTEEIEFLAEYGQTVNKDLKEFQKESKKSEDSAEKELKNIENNNKNAVITVKTALNNEEK